MAFPDRSFFDDVFRGPAPWDVGAAQPDLLALIEERPPSGAVLDLGCGTGDLAIELARRGRRVIGIDGFGEIPALAVCAERCVK